MFVSKWLIKKFKHSNRFLNFYSANIEIMSEKSSFPAIYNKHSI